MKRAVSPDHERRWTAHLARAKEKGGLIDLTEDSGEETVLKKAQNEVRHPPKPQLTSFMKSVGPRDVLFSGPGGSLDQANRHVGNVQFEKLCLSYKSDFLDATTEEEQRTVARGVISIVRQLRSSGRFLVVWRDREYMHLWKGRETGGEELVEKVLQAFQIILGGGDKKRKRDDAPIDPSTSETTPRAVGAVTPHEVPSQSALEKLATVAESAGASMKSPPQVPVLSSKPLPTVSSGPNLLPVRYSNVDLSSLSDDFRHQIGLRDYVSEYYGGDYTRMATEHARLTACPHPGTWEVRLVEAAGRAFDICQQYINPGMELSGGQELHTRTVAPNDDAIRSSKRTRLEGGGVLERSEQTNQEEPVMETLCAGTLTDCKRTACRYVLYVARQLYRSNLQGGMSQWFKEEVLHVLEQGKPEAQDVAVLLLVLAAMEVTQDEKKFGGVDAWSFASMFLVGSSIKLVPIHNKWRTRQRTPSYIRRISGRLLHFHEIIFTGATVNCTRSREFERWRSILQAPGRLERSFVMQDLSLKFRIARQFEKAYDQPAAAAPPPPPAPSRSSDTPVPITPERQGNTKFVG